MLADSTSFTIGGTKYKLPGDERKVIEYADLEAGRSYRPGEKLADGYLSMGDHLFVERWSIYLTPLRRGDVMVFTTEGLEADGRKLADLSGFFYIKRLVGLPGDTLKIVGNVLMIKPAGEEKFARSTKSSRPSKSCTAAKAATRGIWAEWGASSLPRSRSTWFRRIIIS